MIDVTLNFGAPALLREPGTPFDREAFEEGVKPLTDAFTSLEGLTVRRMHVWEVELSYDPRTTDLEAVIRHVEDAVNQARESQGTLFSSASGPIAIGKGPADLL